MAFNSLLDIFDFDPDGVKTTVLRLKMAVDIHKDNVHNYLEVVSRREVKDVFLPFGDCRVAVAVFDKSVEASTLQQWQDVTRNKTLEGETPTLTLLRRPQGIYLELTNSEITEEFLSLYFETRKSGGKEETVQETRITHTDETISAVVQISSDEAIRSVLRKRDHQLKGRVVHLQPYYPEIHDIPVSQRKEDTKIVVPAPSINVLSKEVRHSQAEPLAMKCSPLGKSPAPQGAVNPPLPQCLVKPVSTAPEQFVLETTVALPEPEFFEDRGKVLLIGDTKGFQKHQRVNAVKPCVRATFTGSNDDTEHDKLKNKNDKLKNKNDRLKNKNDFKDDATLPKNAEIKASAAKITMLKIYHFQDKYQTEGLKFDLCAMKCKVVIKAASDQEVKEGMLHVHECFESLKSREERFSPSRLLMMEQQSSQRCWRERCKRKKIKATFEIEVDRKVIIWYGFSETDIDEGCSFLKDEVHMQEIRLRPGQERIVASEAWKEWERKLNVDCACIYVDAQHNVITVESLFDKKTKELKAKIINFMKENIPVTRSEVELKGGKAKVFRTSIERKMRDKALQLGGTFDIEEVEKSPLTLKILVEGDERLKSEFSRLVEQIWHENIDFDKISSKAEDKWLMLRGLNGPTGKTFFQNFEASHKCVIEVSSRGHFILEKPRVTVSEVSPDREETCERFVARGSELDSDSESAESDKLSEAEDHESFDHLEEGLQRKFRYQQAALLQGGMSEKDAVQLAIEESLKESNKPLQRKNERESFNDSNPRQYHRRQFPSNSDTRRLQLGQTEVILMKGVLVDQRADALVNVVSATGNFTDSTVAKSFIDRGGPELEKMYMDMSADTDDTDVVVTTKACGRLKCRAVHHVRLNKGNPQHVCKQAVSEVMQEVLHQVGTSGHSSLAFPPLGVGRMFRYPAKDVADQMLTEINTFAQRQIQWNVHRVTVVVFPKDDATFQEFNSVFSSFNPSVLSRSASVPLALHQPQPYQYGLHQYGLQQYGSQPQQYGVQQYGLQQYGTVPHTSNSSPAAQYIGAPSALRNIHSSPRFLVNQAPKQVAGLQQKYHSHASRRARSGDSRRRTDHRQRRGSLDRIGSPHSMTEQKEKEKAEHKKVRKSRFPDDEPATQLHVVVIAENKDTCIKARNALGKEIRALYLYEEKLSKSQKISKESKEKIIKELAKNDIKSCKDKDGYVLKGQREKVKDVHRSILQILLRDKDTTEDKDTVDDRRKRREKVKRETKEFARVMYIEEPDVPYYWDEYKSELSLKGILSSMKKLFKGDSFKKVGLQPNSRQFAAIIDMINSTFDPNLVGQGQDAAGLGQCQYSKLKVCKIERIENVEMYEKYVMQRQHLFRRLFSSGEGRFPRLQKRSDAVKTDRYVRSVLDGDICPEVNEVFLFHGTQKHNVKVICNSGLDFRVGKKEGMYGLGIYGTECSQKADQYADDKTTRSAGPGQTKNMFLMRMLLGNAFVCSEQNPHKFCRPPCTTCFKDNCKEPKRHAQKFGHNFDSVVGDFKQRLFREFVVYESAQCYPEYLITYERI